MFEGRWLFASTVLSIVSIAYLVLRIAVSLASGSGGR